MASYPEKCRIVAMLKSFYDESAIDGGTEVSVVGGMLINEVGCNAFGREWDSMLKRHEFPLPYIHMVDLWPGGKVRDSRLPKNQPEVLLDYPEHRRGRFLSEIVDIINEYKTRTVESTLLARDWKKAYSFLGKRDRLSIHSMCFLQAAVLQATIAENMGYPHDIPFMLDGGCPDSKCVVIAHEFLTRKFPDYQPDFPSRAGPLQFGDDKQYPTLQAADVIAWTIRRKATEGDFDCGGFRTLLRLLSVRHESCHFDKVWMQDSEGKLRAKLGK
jgi:hypothetical protein